MYNILFVEDEMLVAEVIIAYLQKEGYKVNHTISGIKAIELFKQNTYDLIILDLMLPDISGERVCKNIREKSDVYIFMLTAKSDVDSRVEGLDIGADEYLIKPISPREIVARVNALFRRYKNEERSELYYDGKLYIDVNKRITKVNNLEIHLTPNEFEILEILIRHKGMVLSRDQIIDNMSIDNEDSSDRSIDVHIKNIRKKIEENSRNPRYILTVTKIGYKFGGDI